MRSLEDQATNLEPNVKDGLITLLNGLLCADLWPRGNNLKRLTFTAVRNILINLAVAVIVGDDAATERSARLASLLAWTVPLGEKADASGVWLCLAA